MSNLMEVDHSRVLRIAERLVARRETIAVSESSAGGLISAALLAVPGASAYFVGGGVIYTRKAMGALLELGPDKLEGIRSATEPMARLLAKTVRLRLGADWGLAETGATGPSGNRYGDAAGHACLAVSGPLEASRVLETGSSDRMANMVAFANAALELLEQCVGERIEAGRRAAGRQHIIRTATVTPAFAASIDVSEQVCSKPSRSSAR